MIYGGFVLLFGLIIGAMQTGWFGTVGANIAQANPVALVLAAIALAGTGASDEVSAIFRSTMMLTAAPTGCAAGCRGSSPSSSRAARASATSTWERSRPWSRSGSRRCSAGSLIVAAVGLILRVQSGFRHYDAQHPSP